MSSSELLSSLMWEEIVLGEEYGPYGDVATESDLELWTHVYDQPPPSAEEAPAGLVPIHVLRALRIAFHGIPPGGVLAKQAFHFAQVLEVGQSFRTTVRVADKYVKRGRSFVVLDYSMHLPSGELIAESRQSLIWPRREEQEGPSDVR